jgi:hypothetical protein
MIDSVYKYDLNIANSKKRHCCECGVAPTHVVYALLGGKNRGSYRYCTACAKDLGMIVSTRVASDLLDVDVRTVRSMCEARKLHAFKDKRGWWILSDPHFGGIEQVDE